MPRHPFRVGDIITPTEEFASYAGAYKLTVGRTYEVREQAFFAGEDPAVVVPDDEGVLTQYLAEVFMKVPEPFLGTVRIGGEEMPLPRGYQLVPGTEVVRLMHGDREVGEFADSTVSPTGKEIYLAALRDLGLID